MDGSFACPDCGCPIRLAGASPGRRVICGFCSAFVEVPFLPRGLPKRRFKRRWSSPRWFRWWHALPLWGRISSAILCGAILVATADRLVRSTIRAGETRVLAEMVTSVRDLEGAGSTGEALAELEAVLTVAENMRQPPPQLAGLKRWRSRLSVRDAREKLLALNRGQGKIEPSIAVGDALTLLARAEKDQALTAMVPAIHESLARDRARWVAADAAEARRAIDKGQDARALGLCLRMHDQARELATDPRIRIETESTALATEVIRRSGAIIEPVQGKFTLGTPGSYHRPLIEPLTETLRNRGYLPRPVRSPWTDLWDSLAPYRVTFFVDENQNDPYLGSPNRVSRIEGHLDIRRGDNLVWSERSQGKTKIPLPKAPAYIASRLAVSAHRSPEFERLLYESARESLADRLQNALRNLPDCPDYRPIGTTADLH